MDGEFLRWDLFTLYFPIQKYIDQQNFSNVFGAVDQIELPVMNGRNVNGKCMKTLNIIKTNTFLQ